MKAVRRSSAPVRNGASGAAVNFECNVGAELGQLGAAGVVMLLALEWRRCGELFVGVREVPCSGPSARQPMQNGRHNGVAAFRPVRFLVACTTERESHEK